MEHTFEISGDPISKKRPRFSKRGTYDIQGAAKNFQRLIVIAQMRDKRIEMPLEGPIEMEMIFYTSMTKSVLKSKRKTLETDGTFDWRKPDIDNLEKWLFDLLNGLLYNDDAQIVKIYAAKMYSLEPKTIFTIKTIQKETP